MTSETDAFAPRAWLVDERTGDGSSGFTIAWAVRPTGLAAALLIALVLTISAVPRQRAEGTLPSAAAARLEALPPAVLSLVSGTLGRDQTPYRIHRVATGLAATNDAHGLEIGFDGGGLHVRSGLDTFSLRLRTAGHGQELKAVPAAVPEEKANRVLFRRGPLTEWYANGPLGLEQGFTVKAPLPGARRGPLTLTFALSGSLTPRLASGGRSLTFAGSSLRYEGLAAYDARGHPLPAGLALRGHTLLIRVADAGARYPLTIDPFSQLAKLSSANGLPADRRVSMAISGDTIVAAGDLANLGTLNQGALYVFVKPPGGWASGTETATLTASDPGVDSRLGSSVAIDGDTIAAGSAVGAYVFVKPAGGWANGTESAKLAASDGARLHEVAMSGDSIVAGPRGGAAYVFVKPAGGWVSGTETAKLTASDGVADDFFGESLAISGDTIVAGARYADISGHADQGAAYLFVKPAAGWVSGTETAKLTASDGAADDQLGLSVAVSGDTVVVGAYAADVGGHSNQGAAYVFVEPAGGWVSGTDTAKLTASDGAAIDDFGAAVALSGETIVVGAFLADVSGKVDRGAAYVFVEPAGGWASGTQTAKLTASDGKAHDGFGGSVAIEGETVLVGAAVPSWYSYAHAVYVFGEFSATITVTKQLSPASDPGRFDLLVGPTVVKADAGNGESGSRVVLPGTYRIAENATAGTSLANYATSIACTLNGNPGPSAAGMQLNVTVADGDQLACTITNRRKAQITVAKHLAPADDPGRFDLKVGSTLVRASAGEGDFGSTRVLAGTFTVSEVAAPGTNLANYTSSIACTRNGAPGPSGNGASLKVAVEWGDVLACTITNQPGAKITVTKNLVPASDAGRFDLKVGGSVVKAAAGNGGSGSLGVPAGTYRVAEAAAAGTSLSDYVSSIACTRNGSPGPSATGTPQLSVTAAVGDRLACTITNKRKAQVTLVKHLVPSSDAGRFDLRLTSSAGLVRVARTGAGDGDSGTIQVAPGAWTVLESAASGTSLGDYVSSIVCTRNGSPGPSGRGTSLRLTLSPADLLACTITNQRK